MSIKLGVSGVVRDAATPVLGCYGVERDIGQGFCGTNAVRRQIYDLADYLNRIEFKILYGYADDMDTAGNVTGGQPNTSPDIVLSYGDLSISGTTVQLQCNTRGKKIEISGVIDAILNDGREVRGAAFNDLHTLTFPISYSFSVGSYTSDYQYLGGLIDLLVCGNQFGTGGLGSGSTNVTCTWDGFALAAGLFAGGHGRPYIVTKLQLPSSITVAGKSIPIKIIKKST